MRIFVFFLNKHKHTQILVIFDRHVSALRQYVFCHTNQSKIIICIYSFLIDGVFDETFFSAFAPYFVLFRYLFSEIGFVKRSDVYIYMCKACCLAPLRSALVSSPPTESSSHYVNTIAHEVPAKLRRERER